MYIVVIYSYHMTSSMIMLLRSAVVPENANYFMEVTANDGNGVEVVDATCRSCRFYVSTHGLNLIYMHLVSMGMRLRTISM